METITIIKLSKKQIVAIIAFFVIAFFISILFLVYYNNTLKNKYPIIRKSDLIQGNVKKSFTTGGNAYITLKGGRLFRDNGSENPVYKNNYILGLFLRANDSVYKNKFSDTMFVFRGEAKYYFILKYK